MVLVFVNVLLIKRRPDLHDQFKAVMSILLILVSPFCSESTLYHENQILHVCGMCTYFVHLLSKVMNKCYTVTR